MPVDYAALAAQARNTTAAPPVDYAALAQQARTGAAPAQQAATQTDQPQGFLSSFGDSSGISGIGSAIMHPVQSMKAISDAMGPSPSGPIPQAIAGEALRIGGHVKGIAQAQKENNLPSAISHGISMVPMLGPALDKATDQYADKNYAGEMGTLSGLTAAAVAPKMLEGVPAAIKNPLRGSVDEPIVGTNLTPRARFASAQRLGVNLDAADATNNPFLKGVKKVNENSLFGGNSYENLAAKNTSALQGSTDSFLNKIYPGDREQGGADIQKALKANQEGLQASATAGFDSLPQNVPIPGLAEVGKTAQTISRQNAAYQNLFPSLKPNKAMSVVGDVGGLGPQPPAPIRMSPFVDERGNPIQSASQPAPPESQSFSTGQKLRSDLLDFTRNNPDIVQNQGNGFIQRLAGDTDEALAGASSSLSPSQLNTFRDANANWKDMKATYDDPSSPLYHAVRTDNPSSLFGGIGSKTPENARNLQSRLGPAINPLRKGTVEGALKTTNDGSPNFRNFGTNLNRIPADYRAELFSPGQNSTLNDISNTSNVLNKDFNPSGTAKLGQKMAEGAALLHPTTMAGPLLQYPIAKLMTNPNAVKWLMAPSSAPNPFLAPAASGAALTVPKKKGLFGSS
jgi:hypothetical protein